MRNLHAPCLAASAVLTLFGAMTLAQAAQPLRVSGRPAGSAGTVNWPQPGLDAQHTGYNAQETTISKANIGRLTQKWAVSIPNGIQEAAPVEVNGIAYAQATDGIVYAVNVTTGAVLWTFAGQPLGLTAGGGLVYTTCKVDANGHSGVCALNGATGGLVWSFTVSNVGGQVPTNSSPDNIPVYDRGLIVFGENWGGFDSPVSGDVVYALNATTGQPVWAVAYTTKTDGQPFAIDKGSVFYQTLGDGGMHVCAVNEADGMGQRCSPVLDGNSYAAISVSGGKVLTTYTNTALGNTDFTALDETSLAVVWLTSVAGDTSDYDLSPPAAAHGIAYFHGGYNSGPGLYALSLKTGQQRWAFECAGSTTGCPKSNVSVANGVVFASCGGTKLGDQCAFNAKTGAFLRLYGLTGANNAGSTAAPLVANGAEIGACGDYGGSLCMFAR